MVEMTDAEAAEKLSRSRARMLPILAILLITQQGAYFSQSDRLVDHVRIGAWFVLTAVVLIALVTGGAWIYPKRVRDLANDESTRVHRDKALKLGFINAMVTCLFLYLVSMATRVEAREAIHVITTVGLASALLSFGIMERQALKDG